MFFFFNDTATTEIYTLSLHDALPISTHLRGRSRLGRKPRLGTGIRAYPPRPRRMAATQLDCTLRDRRHRKRREPSQNRSEEHTSELQSQSNIVCRLLLEKKKETPLNGLGPGHQRCRPVLPSQAGLARRGPAEAGAHTVRHPAVILLQDAARTAN